MIFGVLKRKKSKCGEVGTYLIRSSIYPKIPLWFRDDVVLVFCLAEKTFCFEKNGLKCHAFGIKQNPTERYPKFTIQILMFISI